MASSGAARPPCLSCPHSLTALFLVVFAVHSCQALDWCIPHYYWREIEVGELVAHGLPHMFVLIVVSSGRQPCVCVCVCVFACFAALPGTVPGCMIVMMPASTETKTSTPAVRCHVLLKCCSVCGARSLRHLMFLVAFMLLFVRSIRVR